MANTCSKPFIQSRFKSRPADFKSALQYSSICYSNTPTHFTAVSFFFVFLFLFTSYMQYLVPCLSLRKRGVEIGACFQFLVFRNAICRLMSHTIHHSHGLELSPPLHARLELSKQDLTPRITRRYNTATEKKGRRSCNVYVLVYPSVHRLLKLSCSL